MGSVLELPVLPAWLELSMDMSFSVWSEQVHTFTSCIILVQRVFADK